jgi:phage gp46-like protein
VTDIKLDQKRVWLENTFMDWLQTSEGLSEDEELATAVRVAIATDALASIDDVLPDIDDQDRRGWWGDLDAQEIWGGWPIGCKHWLLRRAKISDRFSIEGDTVLRAKAYVRASLQPFVERRIASRFDVEATRVGRDKISVQVMMYRGPRRAIDLRFQVLWADVIES